MPLRLFVLPSSTLLTDHRAHGDGLVAHGFIRALADRGHRLHVAAGGVALREGLPPNVHLHRLTVAGGSAGLVRVRFMTAVRRLYRQLSQEAPFDIVHQLTPVEVGVTLAVADARTPVVLGPYVPEWTPGDDPATVQHPGARRVRQAVRAVQQRRATTVLVTNAAATAMVSRRAPHVRQLPIGIDERTWAPAGTGEGQRVLFLASLDTRKGIYVALDAFARIAPAFPDARFVVAGSGPEADGVRARIRATPELSRVELLGALDREQVVAAMQACDVYCLPSFGEPWGLTALEAMACGKPVVATDASGLAELVPDGGGRKVPPGDPVALADALRELLADPGLRRAMGAHNRRVVEERYAWPRVVDRLEEVYEEAVCEYRRP